LSKQKLNIIHFPRWFPNKIDTSSGIFVLNHILCSKTFANNYVIYADFFDKKNYIEHYNENGIHFSKKYINQSLTTIKFIDVLLKNIQLFFFSNTMFHYIQKKNWQT
jgi:hypothetical protein